MTTHAQFYLTRAALARELADGSKLDNVKESHLRAAEAWDGFAARAIKADLMRAEELKRKSATSGPVDSDDSVDSSNDPELRQNSESVQNAPVVGAF